MPPTATAARLVRSLAGQVFAPDQMTSAAPARGSREAMSAPGISGRNSRALTTIAPMPIAESASDIGLVRRTAASAASTIAPMANSKMRNGVRKNAALGSVLLAMIESASEAQPTMAMMVNTRPDFDASTISAGQNR